MKAINDLIVKIGPLNVAIAGIVIIVFIISILVYKSVKLRKVKKELVELEDKMNATKTLPIQYRLGRVKGIAKAMPDVLEKYKKFAVEYERLTELQGNDIVSLINEIDEQFFYRKLKGSKEKLNKLRSLTEEFEKDSNQLLKEIEEVTEIENKQRLEIIKVKEKYRLLTDSYSHIRLKIDDFIPEIQNRFKEIDNKFVELEVMMNHQDFDNSQSLTKEVESEIEVINGYIKDLPTYVSVVRNFIPKQMDEIQNAIDNLTEKGFSLEKINTSLRFNKIEFDLKNVVQNLRQLNLGNIGQDLELITDEISSLKEDFEKEEAGYKVYSNRKEKVFRHIYNIDRTLQAAIESLDELETNYKLDNCETDIREKAQEFESILDEVSDITNLIESNEFSYDEMVKSLDGIDKRCDPFDETIQKYESLYDGLVLKEKRALDELENINIVLLEIKSEIKNKHLPMINESYKDYIEDSYQKADQIISFIKQRPIDLDELSNKVDAARDVIYKLYDNVHNLIVTSEMVEDAIIFGNRYRSTFLEVNTELTKAEILYRNGEYTKALSTAVDIIEKVDPGSYEMLVKKSTNKSLSLENA